MIIQRQNLYEKQLNKSLDERHLLIIDFSNFSSGIQSRCNYYVQAELTLNEIVAFNIVTASREWPTEGRPTND